MDFRENTSIYVQIRDYICEKILLGKYKQGERIPSVRELGMELEVNPNTVLRGYELLQNEEIIFNKRGLGYFVKEDAIKKIQKGKKEDFIKNILPDVFKTMRLLDIDFDELKKMYEKSDKVTK